jgi:chorismate synthase
MLIDFETAGESHGECLVATLTGLPAGIPIAIDAINRELRTVAQAQQGFGRGGRMKIETDRATLSRACGTAKTIGSPIAMIIQNRLEELDRIAAGGSRRRTTNASPFAPSPRPCRPAGAIKYNFQDARYILERASARETTARVAVGALAKAVPLEFGIEVLSHVIAVGSARLGARRQPGKNWSRSAKSAKSCSAASTRCRAAHEGRGRSGLPHRRHRRRHL